MNEPTEVARYSCRDGCYRRRAHAHSFPANLYLRRSVDLIAMRVCDYSVKTEWGLEPLPRDGGKRHTAAAANPLIQMPSVKMPGGVRLRVVGVTLKTQNHPLTRIKELREPRISRSSSARHSTSACDGFQAYRYIGRHALSHERTEAMPFPMFG